MLAGLLPMLWLCGCSIAPVNVADGGYTPLPPRQNQDSTNKPMVVRQSTAFHCSIYLDKVDDKRADKDDMGSVAGRPVHGGDMAVWLSSGLSSLQADGYHVDTQPAADDAIKVHVDLLKAYMRSVYTSISSNIAVRITYMRPDGALLGQEIYRGIDTSMNWASGDGEINTDFKLATADLLKNVEPDIDRYCASAQQPASVTGAAL